MAFPAAAKAQLSTHHGVGERVDVKLARHLHDVGVCRGFGDLDESHEAAFCKPLPESGGDHHHHLVGRVGDEDGSWE